MGWEFFVFIRVIGQSFHSLGLKNLLDRPENSLLAIPFFLVLTPALLFTAIAQIQGVLIPSLGNHAFLVNLAGNVICNSFNYLLNMWLIRRYDISYLESLKASLPLFAAFFASIFLQEYLAFETLMAIFVIVFGCFLLELSRFEAKAETKDMGSLLKRFFNGLMKSGWFFMIPYLCLNAIATIFSKGAVLAGPIEAYLGLRYLCLSFFFVTIGYVSFKWAPLTGKKHLEKKAQLAKHQSFTTSFFNAGNAKAMLVGLFLCISVAGEMRALQLADVALVETLSKASLFLILFGELIYLKKSLNKLRIIAGTTIILGIFAFFLTS